MKGSAIFLPIKCGAWPTIQNALYPRKDLRFGESGQVTCNEGFLQGSCVDTPANCSRTETAACEHAQRLSMQGQATNTLPTCRKRTCGVCTELHNATATHPAPPQKLFGDLCNYRCDPDFTVTQLPGSPAKVSLICDSSSNFQAVRTNLRGMTSRRGRKSCRRKMIGKRLCSWLERTLAEDQKYTPEIARIIRDDFLQQNGFTEYDVMCPLAKTIGMMKVIVGFYEVAQKTMAELQGSEVWRCCRTAIHRYPVKQIHGYRLPEEGSVPVPDRLLSIGVFGWDRDSSVRCQSVGKFTPTVPCLPNTVGQPPFVNTSQYGDKVYFYPETLEDTCRQGYVHAGNSTLRVDPDVVWVFARPFH